MPTWIQTCSLFWVILEFLSCIRCRLQGTMGRSGNLQLWAMTGRPSGLHVCKTSHCLQTPQRTDLRLLPSFLHGRTSKEYLAKEVELKAEAKVLGQPRILQIHERQAMLKAVETIHGTLSDAECPSADYLSLKAEETEANEPTAAPLDEILSKLASSSSLIQSSVDGSGHIRVTRTKTKAKMPATTEEYRRVMKVEMFSWLAMASRYKAKHWLNGLTAAPFLKFVEFILGDRVYGIQIPTADGGQQKIRPDWAIVLSFEQRLRKEAMKRVMEGHTLSDALSSVIKDADLKEAYFTTPVALKSAAYDNPPNKFQRFNSKGSFSGKSFQNFSKGKGKGKQKLKTFWCF